MEQALARWTLELCAIASETGQEGALCDHLEALLGAFGGLELARIGNSLVVRAPRAPDRPTIGLFGHLDTVKPAADQPLGIEGGRIYGCGASDMKAGLAVMIALLAEHEALLGANLIAVFYDKEEGPALENGLEPVLESGAVGPLDLALCLEPTDNELQLGCVGGLHAELRFEGRRAHSARPWQGQNAIHRAAGLLDRLARRERQAVDFGPLRFYEVLSATTAHTENSRNVVPDAFFLNLNYRFAPGKSLDQAEAELRDFVGTEASVTIRDRAPSGAVCLDHPLLTPWRLAQGLTVAPKQAWTDVARLSARGIPSANFGPGETAQAHQARESAPVELLLAHHRALRALFT